MHLISCPFCGPRDETEFRYGTEADKQPGKFEASADEWAHYLYFQNNVKGDAREIWLHLACCEFFLVERNTLSHVIHLTQSLRREDRS